MATLTNGSKEAVEEQLSSSGLGHFFERSISVDEVRRFKPAPEVYLHAAAVLEVTMSGAIMVAAHDWDILGARAAGMPGAFITRRGTIWGLPDASPDLVAADLAILADLLIDAWPREGNRC